MIYITNFIDINQFAYYRIMKYNILIEIENVNP